LHDGDSDTRQKLGQILGLHLQFGFLTEMGLAFLLDDFLVGSGSRYCQPLGQEKIARITRSDFYYLAAGSQLVDVFSKNDFHG
jgi:hypothetical protein